MKGWTILLGTLFLLSGVGLLFLFGWQFINLSSCKSWSVCGEFADTLHKGSLGVNTVLVLAPFIFILSGVLFLFPLDKKQDKD